VKQESLFFLRQGKERFLAPIGMTTFSFQNHLRKPPKQRRNRGAALEVLLNWDVQPALWEIVAEVDVHHELVSGRWSANRHPPGSAGVVGELSHEADITVIRIPPEILMNTEGRFKNVPVVGVR
jgi:hypothetical protein